MGSYSNQPNTIFTDVATHTSITHKEYLNKLSW